MARPNSTHTRTVGTDDTFELYDLKVEVICPPNERIFCGAKDGDYFLLEGEMLKLPPGQGISIYSLSKHGSRRFWFKLGSDPQRFYYQAPYYHSLPQNRGQRTQTTGWPPME